MNRDKLIKALGSNIAMQRKIKGLSQEDLAFVIGKTTNTISNIERGINAGKLDTLLDIAKALEVDITDFFDLSFNTRMAIKDRKKINEIVRILSSKDTPFITNVHDNVCFMQKLMGEEPLNSRYTKKKSS